MSSVDPTRSCLGTAAFLDVAVGRQPSSMLPSVEARNAIGDVAERPWWSAHSLPLLRVVEMTISFDRAVSLSLEHEGETLLLMPHQLRRQFPPQSAKNGRGEGRRWLRRNDVTFRIVEWDC